MLVMAAYNHSQGEVNQLKRQRGVSEPTKLKSCGRISFTAKCSESVLSWVAHIDSFLGDTPGSNSLDVACCYLEGHVHE